MQLNRIEDENGFTFLQGGGEMGDLIRNYNWDDTPIGNPRQWSQSLRTTLSIIINSKFPMFLWWGKNLIQFYNDAYRPSFGITGKHPTALGQKGEDCWPEIWPVIYPLINSVFSGGEATWNEDQLIPIYRNEKMEDVYWTFSYSAVNDESGEVGGVLVVCNETTEKIKAYQDIITSEGRFQNLVGQATVGIIVLMGEEMIVDIVNDAYGVLSGRKVDDLRSKPLFEVIPEAEETFRPLLEKVRKSGEAIYLHDHPYNVLVDGNMRNGYLDIVYQPYKESNGSISGVMVLCHDTTEQVNARKKSEENEHRFRTLIQSTPFPMCLYTGREMKINIVNDALLKTWGRDKSVIGMHLQQAIPELQGQPFLKLLDDVFINNHPLILKDTESQVMHEGESRTYYHDLWYIPMTNEANEVYGILAAGVDVTEKVIAQKKIKESEQNLRNIILQAPVAMCILKGDNYVVEIANDRMYELWGKPYAAVINKPIFEALPEAKDQGLEKLLDDVFTTGETFSAYGLPINLPRNGKIETVYLNFVYEAFRAADGSITGVMAVASDVTMQVLAGKKIESSEARFRLMADAIPQFVWTGDAQGNLNYFNQAVYNYSGMSYEQIQNGGWLNIVHPEERDENIKRWVHAIESGDDFVFQHRFKNRHGDYRWQLSRAVPQKDSDGIILSWVGTSTDIHEQKTFSDKLEVMVEERTEELLNVNYELERSNQELKQFAYVASHDLQEPLRKIITFTNRFIEKYKNLPEGSDEYLQKIINSSKRMSQLIHDLLDFSSTTRVADEFVQTNLNVIIKEVLNEFEVEIQNRNAVIDIQPLPVITAIPMQMTQLFHNLLSNSFKFSQQNMHLTITCRKVQGKNIRLQVSADAAAIYWEIIFKDDGIGFEQKFAEQIFTIFQRLHGRHEYEGTGIGLAHCKKITDNHNGFITATSKEKEGAAFHIFLPA